jgi:alpha-1,2-mannosyltransferase
MSTTVQPARAQRLAGRSVVVVVGSAAALFAITTFIHRYGLVDLAAQRAAVRSWADGGGLYGYRSAENGLGTTLPPVAALALAPLAFLPLWMAGVLLGALGVGALVLALIALGRSGGPALPAAALAGRVRGRGAGVTLEPVRAALGRGDLDLLAFGLITADVVALRRGAWATQPCRLVAGTAGLGGRAPGWCGAAGIPAQWAGVGTGLAAALTVGPVLFLGYFAVTRQWRAALTGLATVVALLGTAVLAAPHGRRPPGSAGAVAARSDRWGRSCRQPLPGRGAGRASTTRRPPRSCSGCRSRCCWSRSG